MTNPYTPEKVADLVGRLREVIDTATSDSFTVENDHCVGRAEHDAISAERDEAEAVRDEIIAALTAVSAERDRLHKAITEALEPKNIGYGHMDIALVRVERILRAALDKEGNDDDH